MSAAQPPPWLQEHMLKMQQTQQNIQAVAAQRQHLEMEGAETEKALEELKKASDEDAVFKHAGTVMVRSTRAKLIEELEERRELAKTRATVLQKQDERLQESFKEQNARLSEMVKGGQKPADENPRK